MSHIELRVPVSETTHRRLLRWCQDRAEFQGVRRVTIREAVAAALDLLLSDPGKAGAVPDASPPPHEHPLENGTARRLWEEATPDRMEDSYVLYTGTEQQSRRKRDPQAPA